MSRGLRYFALGTALLLGGCAQYPVPVTSHAEAFNPRVSCNAVPTPEERVELEMVDTLDAQDRPYAAIAQLQRMGQSNQEYWMRYGQLLVKTDDMARARTVFSTMQRHCNSGQSHHGLGIIAMKEGRVHLAVAHFEQAVNRMPASVQARNDYGYALLTINRAHHAVPHLRTAFELQNGEGPARQNLAVAYLLSNDHRGLDMLIDRYGFSDHELAHARDLARQMRR